MVLNTWEGARLFYLYYGIICLSVLHNFLTLSSVKDFVRSLESLEIFLCLYDHRYSEAYHCLVKAAAWVVSHCDWRGHLTGAVKSRSLVFPYRCELRKHIHHTWKVFVVEQFDEQLFNRNSAMVGLEKISHAPKHTWSFCVSLYALDIMMCTHLSLSVYSYVMWCSEQSWSLRPLDSP